MARLHLDEAREAALKLVVRLVTQDIVRWATVIVDLQGRISLAVWTEQKGPSNVADQFLAACGEHWTGTVYTSQASNPENDDDLLTRTAWNEGVSLENERARVTDRFRHHTSWRTSPVGTRPLWSLDEGPPLIVFHGFKGGVGRTTLLASYALACAQRGTKVAVVDVDLDAPGLGTLLAADESGTTARWGTVDYLLESSTPHPIEDYFHVVAREALTGAGRIEVVPAGQLDDGYVPKLARVDLELHGQVEQHPLVRLLRALRERGPSCILLDGRAGLSPAAGLLLSGFAHLHVLIATSNPQSLAGLERVVRHLGFEAARSGLPQLDCLVVQALVPDGAEAAKPSRDVFDARIEEIFRNGYYARSSPEDDAVWSIDDLDSKEAPHVAVPIPYRAALAHYASINSVADLLTKDGALSALHTRIDERVLRGEEGEDERNG